MKSFVLAAAVFAVLLAICAADGDAGHFIPKAFYTLDAEGHKTEPHPVSPHTAQYLRRLRRETFSSSSSSSSSSVSSNGGPVYFTSQQSVHHTPDSGVNFASRFGEDSSSPQTSSSSSSSSSVSANGGPVYFSTQQAVHNSPPAGGVSFSSRFGESDSSLPVTGKIVQTTGFIDEKGIVHSKTTTTNTHH